MKNSVPKSTKSPWLGVGIALGILAACLAVFFLTYKIESYPLKIAKDVSGDVRHADAWIVTLQKENSDKSKEYKICLDDRGNPTYTIHYRGLGTGDTYFNSEGQYIGSSSIDDTGTTTSDGAQPELVGCENVPKWFFELKVQTNTH